MNATWLVVADNSRARFFSMDSRNGPIEETRSIIHMEARLKGKSMTSDAQGRGSGKGGEGMHAYQDKVSPREQENINFAREISTELDMARKQNKFKQFVLVAAPNFLGKLREQMNKETKRLASFELAKNLSHLEAAEIRKHLPERLPAL